MEFTRMPRVLEVMPSKFITERVPSSAVPVRTDSLALVSATFATLELADIVVPGGTTKDYL